MRKRENTSKEEKTRQTSKKYKTKHACNRCKDVFLFLCNQFRRMSQQIPKSGDIYIFRDVYVPMTNGKIVNKISVAAYSFHALHYR